jgi:hypothetical protein
MLKLRRGGREASWFGGLELAGLAIARGLGLMATPAARPEIAVRRGPICDMRLDMVVLGAEAVAAIDAADPVEFGRLAELERDRDLDRNVS